MHNKLTCLILSLFVAVSTAAQNIEIPVKLGNEPAEYAFIFKNGCYLGNCDSLGRFDIGVIERGDSLKASVAGFSSEVVVYDGKAKAVTLNVKTGVLAGAKVMERNLKRVDEYVSLVHSVPFEWRVFGREHYVWKMTISQNSKGPVRISEIKLHGRVISTGVPLDVVIGELHDAPLTKTDWKKIKWSLYWTIVR